MLKYLASLMASMTDGLYRPFSRELMVCLETPMASASSSCLMPFCFRISSSLFFKILPFLIKYAYLKFSRVLSIRISFSIHFALLLRPVLRHGLYRKNNVKFTFHNCIIQHSLFMSSALYINPQKKDKALYFPDFVFALHNMACPFLFYMFPQHFMNDIQAEARDLPISLSLDNISASGAS